MSVALGYDPDADAAALLAYPADQRSNWLAARRGTLRIELLTALKCRSDALLRSNPIASDDTTRCALLVAQHMPDQPLAEALAHWARGNWEAFHDPPIAIQSYQRAQAGYRVAGDSLSVARLAGNLVFAFADSGRFDAAQQAYRDAREVFVQLGGQALPYLLLLEQNYGWLLHNQGLYHEALAVDERALALAAQLTQPVIAAEVQVNRALTYATIGRMAEAEAALCQARLVAEAHGERLTVARIDMDLGELASAQGRPAEALRHLQAAQAHFAALDNPMELGSVLLRRAMLFERIGAIRVARQAYAQAQAQFTALDMQPQVGIALVRGAAASRLDGVYTRATALLDQAEALWHGLGQQAWSMELLFERAELALQRHDAAAALAAFAPPLAQEANLAQQTRHDVLLGEAHAGLGDAQAAWALFARALRSAERSGDTWLRRRALAGLGRLALHDDPASARGYLEFAAAIDDQLRLALSVEELKASFQAQATDVLPILAELAVDQQQPDQALSDAWRAKGSALLDLMRTKNERVAPVAELQQIEALRRDLAAQRWRLTSAHTQDADAAATAHQDAKTRALEQRLFELRQQRNQSTHGRAATLDDLRLALARMDADEHIEYLRCGKRLLALRADPSGSCRAVWLGEIDPLFDLLDRLRLRLQNVVICPAEQRARHHDTWLAECLPLLRQCYDRLIAPLGEFPPDARLLIAPCDPLYLLPFAALWDGRQYLAERYELRMIPSGALLTLPPDATTSSGAPLVIAASAEQRLAAVAAEATAIAAAFPDSRIRLDDGSALAELRSMTAAPRLLHIAAHSSLREDAPIFSALQLNGELLSVEECYELPLAGTELVTLSACTSATGLDTGGSLLAFQSAFLIAGARRVISSLWLIDDQASAVWMRCFYQLLAAGMPAPTALRRTQRIQLDEPASAHPAIWAAFICSQRG